MDVGVAVVKNTPFQGRIQALTNVYHYTGVGSSDEDVEALLDAVVAAEKGIFASTCEFSHGRAWNTNDAAPNVMRVSKVLSGLGAMTESSTMYKECAIMMRWFVGRKTVTSVSTSNPVRSMPIYLRKYLHTCQLHGYDARGVNPIGSITPTGQLLTYRNAIQAPVSGATLCAPDGTVYSEAGELGKYLEHRQLRKGRKEA